MHYLYFVFLTHLIFLLHGKLKLMFYLTVIWYTLYVRISKFTKILVIHLFLYISFDHWIMQSGGTKDIIHTHPNIIIYFIIGFSVVSVVFPFFKIRYDYLHLQFVEASMFCGVFYFLVQVCLHPVVSSLSRFLFFILLSIHGVDRKILGFVCGYNCFNSTTFGWTTPGYFNQVSFFFIFVCMNVTVFGCWWFCSVEIFKFIWTIFYQIIWKHLNTHTWRL